MVRKSDCGNRINAHTKAASKKSEKTKRKVSRSMCVNSRRAASNATTKMRKSIVTILDTATMRPVDAGREY